MYRTTAEAVSGTRVYADGKWLRCIGNKRVSVGDCIWTDGRCVYGHEQESQQPQVITAQEEEEGIPIIIRGDEHNRPTPRWTLYTFKKNKLKRVAVIIKENGKYNLYNDVAGELKLVNEIAENDKWTSYSLMINDFRKTVSLYDEGTHYKAKFYNPTGSSDYAENNFCTDTELIASNIDKAGNRFDMVIRYEAKFEPYDSFYITERKAIYTKAVEILENGNVVNSVDITKIVDEVIADCPDAEQCYDPEEFNGYNTFFFHDIGGTFIENAQTWCFWLEIDCSKETFFLADAPVDSEITGWRSINNFYSNTLNRLYLITANKTSIVSESSSRWVDYDDGTGTGNRIHEPTYLTKPTHTATFPIQDGYYCKAYDWFEVSTEKFANLKRYAYVTFFAPNDKELFTGIFLLPIPFPFYRIGSKYLLAVDSNAELASMYGGKDPQQVFEHGIFLGAGNNWQKLSSDTEVNWHVLNQRFRPMKKIRGWQNRLQAIEIEQEEI